MLDLLALDGKPFWHYRRYGVEALLAMGKKSEALQYAEAYRRYGLRGALSIFAQVSKLPIVCNSLSSGLS